MNLHWVLLLGVALNWLGALQIAVASLRELRTVQAPPDYWQLRFFVAGTAATFGAMYLYLFFHAEYVRPFLWFSANAIVMIMAVLPLKLLNRFAGIAVVHVSECD
jgi:hypothetical protein